LVIKFSGREGLKWKALPLVHVAYRLVGRRWGDFYAWMLDRQERGNRIEKIISRSPTFTGVEHSLYDLSVAPLHLELLKSHGLKPDSAILDFGCGFGRSAASLVPYLNPGHYVGVDLSVERIRLADDYMRQLGLADRKPQFFVARRDNDLTFLGCNRFDVFWARAVLSHMPLEDVAICLRQAYAVLKNDGIFIGDYISDDEFRKTSIKDFHFPEADMVAVVQSCGFNYSVAENWDVGIPTEYRGKHGHPKMLCLRKR
jgi:SAM-dependent methyltransferase